MATDNGAIADDHGLADQTPIGGRLILHAARPQHERLATPQVRLRRFCGAPVVGVWWSAGRCVNEHSCPLLNVCRQASVL